jgi:molybdopterin/thiamine biosynthesis adenylyltransferase
MAILLDKNIWPESLRRNQPSLSTAEQAMLIRSRVAVIGCGGLGGYLACFCARLGVGSLLLVDNDVYDITNMNRQCLCTGKTLGKNKADITAEYCQDIHEWIEIRSIAEKITRRNAARLLSGVDLVLDGLDKIADRFILYEATRRLRIPFVHGAVMGWSGQTTTFMPETIIGLDAIYPDPKDADNPPSVLAPSPAIIAALQCQEALRILTGKKPKNEGSLICYDGEEMCISKLNFSANKKYD